MAATELVTAFRFIGDTKPLEKFNFELADAVGLTLKAAAIFTAGAAAVNAFAVATLASVDAQAQLANTLGVSIENIQKLGFVASVNGSSIDSLTQSLEGLNEKAGEAAIQGNEAFNRLGINVRTASGEVKKADTLLLEVGRRIRELRLSQAEEAKLLTELGISRDLAQTLRLSTRELSALSSEAEAFGIITSEQAEQVIDFNDSLTKATFGMDALRKMIAISLAPQLTALSDDFIDFLKANNELITRGLTKTFEVMNAGVLAITRVGKSLFTLIDDTIGLKGATILLTGAIIKMNAAFLLSPVGKAVQIIGILLTVVEDLIVAFAGGNSVIKTFFKDTFDIDIVKGIADTFVFMGDSIAFVVGLFAPLLKGLNSFFFLTSKLAGAVGLDIFDFSDSLNEAEAGLQELQDRSYSKIGGAVTGLINGGGTTTSSNSIAQDVTINITTSDPQAAGEAANQAIKREYDTVNTLNNRRNF